MTCEIEALTVRIARLERANRWLKLIVTGIVMASILFGSMGLAGKSRTVEAEKFVILDAQGRARLMIGMHEASGSGLPVKPDIPAIWLSDENGSDRTMLTSDGLYFADSHEKTLVNLSSGLSGPELRFYRPDGKVSWSAP